MAKSQMDIEEALQRLGIPDDIDDFMQVTENLSLDPDLETVERVKERTLRMVRSESENNLCELRRGRCEALKKGHSVKWWYLTAAAAAVLLIILSTGPNNVRAAVNSMLSYIPGFGLHSTENVTLAAPYSVRAERAGVKIDINGVLADRTGTSVMAYVQGSLPDMQSSYLVDSAGRRYPYRGGSIGQAGTGTSAFENLWAGYTVLPSTVREVALVIPSLSNWRINIPLAPVSSLSLKESFGPSDTVHNVTVSCQASSFPDETKITFLAQSLRGGVLQNVNQPILTGQDAKTYLLKAESAGFMGSGLDYFSANPGIGKKVSVTVPSLVLEQDLHGRAVVPLQTKGSPLALNQSLSLGPWNLKLTKEEMVSQDGTWLRFYVHSNSVDGAAISSLGLAHISVNGKELSSWASRMSSSGSMEWFEIPVPKESRDSWLTVAVDSVNIWVRGPWKMEVPVIPGFK